jgi:hypothetical protein
MDLCTKFQLGPEITREQQSFLDAYGFLHFRRVASEAEVEMLRSERDRLEKQWLESDTRSVNGIPLFFGRDEQGERIIQRIPFTSRYSEAISSFVRDPRFEPIRRLVGEDARVGEMEKDGVVINRYLNLPGNFYRGLGWHTDGLRDLFYLRMPVQMLNVGIHFDRITKEEGGLRLIPGSHTQGFWSMCFRKPYFVSHREDPEEIAVETEPGDLTVHDGRLWHRVARAKRVGNDSVRRTMFVPYLTGPYEPKDATSRTPAYHHLGQLVRELIQRR